MCLTCYTITPDPLEGSSPAHAQSPPCLLGHSPAGIAVLEGGVGNCLETARAEVNCKVDLF